MKKTVTCPLCGKEIKRQIELFQKHYLVEHDELLSEGNVFKFITRSTSGTSKRKYTTNFERNYREVNGGHYGLGRSRKH